LSKAKRKEDKEDEFDKFLSQQLESWS